MPAGPRRGGRSRRRSRPCPSRSPSSLQTGTWRTRSFFISAATSLMSSSGRQQMTSAVITDETLISAGPLRGADDALQHVALGEDPDRPRVVGHHQRADLVAVHLFGGLEHRGRRRDGMNLVPLKREDVLNGGHVGLLVVAALRGRGSEDVDTKRTERIGIDATSAGPAGPAADSDSAGRRSVEGFYQNGADRLQHREKINNPDAPPRGEIRNPKSRNPKHEIRNPKQKEGMHIRNEPRRRRARAIFDHFFFLSCICFGFRDFGFSIFPRGGHDFPRGGLAILCP